MRERIPTTAARWEVDPVALATARELLEIRRPVEIKLTNQYRSNGRWSPRMTPRGVVHVVRLASDLSRAQASRTLWHELAHASQFDRLVADDTIESALVFAERHQRERALPYFERPAEVEARAASDFHDELPLTRAPNAVALRPWKAPTTEGTR